MDKQIDEGILQIEENLENLWRDNENAKSALLEANFTTAQQKFVSMMIANALQSYHNLYHKDK